MKESKWFKIDDTIFSSKRKAETLKEAFEKTIEKWKLIVKGYDPNREVNTCGLCNLFNLASQTRDCLECPIFGKTNKQHCQGTPFEMWSKEEFADISIEIAKKELAFLKRLQKSTLKVKVKK